MGTGHRCAWPEPIRWFTLGNLLRLGRRSGRRQEFTHLLLEKIGQFDATRENRRQRRNIFGKLGNVPSVPVSAMISNVGSLRRVAVCAGPQRAARLVGADDDARGDSLRADEREFTWRSSIRKDTFAGA